jgi:signal transduction histidine kinase
MREAANMYGLVSLIDKSGAGHLESRMIATMRLILASSGLLIIFIDPSEPDRNVALTYATLVLYTLYSAALYLFARSVEAIRGWAHWLDVGWFTALVALSSGVNSLFFFGFPFAILVASFRLGFRPGLRVAVVSALLFAVVGLATRREGPEFELNRFLLRPVYLLALGYMMAYWGGFELSLKRRLALLKEINRLSNPRFGVDRTIGSILERLRAFYDADLCLLLIFDPVKSEFVSRRATRSDPEAAVSPKPVAAELAQKLLSLPADCAIAYRDKRRGRRASFYAYDFARSQRAFEGRAEAETLAVILDTESFVSAPLRYHRETQGRLFLTAHHGFDQSDVEFIHQVVEQFMPVVDSVRLVDRLASDAAEEERRRIARDIHDSIIQPYVGFQIGLAAIQRKLAAGDKDVIGDVERLGELTNAGIADLRNYISTLKDAAEHEGSLLTSVQRFARKFAETTGVEAQVEAEGGIQVGDRLAAEAFQLVVEGLSNIRRHTNATSAKVRLVGRDDRLILQIENEGEKDVTWKPFTPRSITERAESLGGQARVEQDADGNTVVIVEIPL